VSYATAISPWLFSHPTTSWFSIQVPMWRSFCWNTQRWETASRACPSLLSPGADLFFCFRYQNHTRPAQTTTLLTRMIKMTGMAPPTPAPSLKLSTLWTQASNTNRFFQNLLLWVKHKMTSRCTTILMRWYVLSKHRFRHSGQFLTMLFSKQTFDDMDSIASHQSAPTFSQSYSHAATPPNLTIYPPSSAKFLYTTPHSAQFPVSPLFDSVRETAL
jgi:hypothetical protein